MKKKIVIISLIAIFIIVASIFGFYIYLNYRDSQISLINENIEIEYGERYDLSIKDLIDLDKYNFIDLDKVSFKNEMVINEEKGYSDVGEYTIHIYYKDLELIQNVIVKDSISPEIKINEKVELPYNTDLENYNFEDYIKVKDLSETKEYKIDFSNVNKEVAGEYVATIEVEDIYENKSKKEFKIIIQEKQEEIINEEIPSTNKSKINSNQDNSSKNNTDAQKANKASKTNNNNNSSSQTSTSSQTTTSQTTKNNNQSNTQTTQSNTAYWCVDGGNHHIAGDGANEHGYYKTWDSANEAFIQYTKDWDSCHYKIDVCACGLYYFWAIK